MGSDRVGNGVRQRRMRSDKPRMGPETRSDGGAYEGMGRSQLGLPLF